MRACDLGAQQTNLVVRGRAPWLLVVLVALLGTTRGALAADGPESQIAHRRGVNCHGQTRIAELGPDERQSMVAPPADGAAAAQAGPATRPALHVTPDALAGSVHARLACTDCHKDAEALPHPQKLERATCNSSCHAVERGDYLQGAHAKAMADGNPLAPDCASCHGGHDVRPKRDRQSRTHPLNVVRVCGDCHEKHQTTSNGHNGQQHVASYLDSVHGRAIAQTGLAVAATCADCHGEHKVLPSADPASSVSRQHVAETCGQDCHVGVAEVFATSVHSQQVMAGNEKAPVCSDCHTAHAITRTRTPSFMLDIVNECGDCHADLYASYRRSYHGQVTALGYTRAARCSDCHGAHDIMRIQAPLSRLNDQNRARTCATGGGGEDGCHANATPNFASFAPHADHRDPEKFPVLHGVWLYFVIMMSFAFGFFGLHSLMWLIRSSIERVRHGPHPPPAVNPHAILRFNRVDRVNHAFVIISFFGLTLTGLPLLYSEQAWAHTLMLLLGGVDGAGAMHRVFAVMLIGNFAVHFVGVARRIRRYGLFNLVFGPTTMLPRWKDITDCLGMWRWFFVGGAKPRFDRWTYWEKFDYVAEVGGSMIIAVTGLILWFPGFFGTFLPGWMFNVATLIHGYEALLAIGFIFTIHFFNAHLRLEKFPVDDVIFTGRMSEEEFKHERPTEYERLVARGELDALKVKPAATWWRPLTVTAGVLAMLIGTTLVVLIILAGWGLI